MTRAIERLAVVGNGLAASMAALLLARHLPGVTVTQVPTASPGAVGDSYASLSPGSLSLLRGVGVDEGALLARAGGVFRLGHRMAGWGSGTRSATVGWGGLGGGVGGVPLDVWWIAARQATPIPPFNGWSVAAMLADAGRFAPPGTDEADPLGELEVGIAADPVLALRMMADLARGAGVVEASALRFVEVADGRVRSLHLADGRSVTADLFVDATGSGASLLSALTGGAERDDWSALLPVRQVALGRSAAEQSLPPVDITVAEPSGYRLLAPLVGSTVVLRCRNGAGQGDGEPMRLSQGRRRRAWIGNCVAIGDAAVEIEPLLPLHLDQAVAAVARIVDLLPGASCAAIETGQYNRDWAEASDHWRDLVATAHAVGGHRRSAGAPPRPIPEPVAELLELWRARGYLPERDREPWGRPQWLQLLLGIGPPPADADPRAAAIDRDAAARVALDRRRAIATAVAKAPSHADVVAQLTSARAA